jgi:mannose-6-phosphate isomerase-like protein (cupin superfamily)
MGYELIDTDDLEPLPDRSSTGLELSDHYASTGSPVDDEPERGPENVGLRVYHAAPGEALGTGMHYHEEQEEIFYVVEGTLHVETPEGEIPVGPGQALVVEPKSPQRAFNPDDATEPVHVVAIGAPSYSVLGRNDGQPYDPDERA